MGFWSFIRDMIVIDWLFGHHRRSPFGDCNQGDSSSYTGRTHNDDHNCGGFVGPDYNDYALQDFEDDLDSDMFDDDF